MTGKRALVWLRRDLRLEDNAVLEAATSSFEEVVVAFVFDTTILDRLTDPKDRRVSFIHRSVRELDQKLAEHQSRLIVLHGDPVDVLPKLAKTLCVDAVFAGRDPEPAAKNRDENVTRRLSASGISLQLVKDQVVFEGNEVLTKSAEPFKVFTPFKKAWLERFTPADAAPRQPALSHIVKGTVLAGLGDPWDMADIGFEPTDTWLSAGESAAKERLSWFEERMADYGEKRDFPATEGVSGLSVHLRFGTISARAAVRSALHNGSAGSEKWLSELIWREFYQSILWHFPHVATGSFRPEYDGLVWPGDESHFEAWCAGQTGYPLVDAAMRCLRETGWMHNRLRMVVASFLTKDLLVDWRKGEAWFAAQLLDFDLASNNGGWQWAASTGVDPQPYFRIFNPVLQSLKFDPDGVFIRQWCPELGNFEGRLLHWPHEACLMEQDMAGCRLGRDYPRPLVGHATQKEKAVALLGSIAKPGRP